MNKQSLIITIEVLKNDKPYVFSLPYGAPFEEAISAANDIIEIITQAAAQKAQEPAQAEAQVIEQ